MRYCWQAYKFIRIHSRVTNFIYVQCHDGIRKIVPFMAMLENGKIIIGYLIFGVSKYLLSTKRWRTRDQEWNIMKMKPPLYISWILKSSYVLLFVYISNMRACVYFNNLNNAHKNWRENFYGNCFFSKRRKSLFWKSWHFD